MVFIGIKKQSYIFFHHVYGLTLNINIPIYYRSRDLFKVDFIFE